MLSEDKEGAGMYARRSTAHLADREGVESGEWGLSVVGSDLRVALSSFWRGVLWGKVSWASAASSSCWRRVSWWLRLHAWTRRAKGDKVSSDGVGAGGGGAWRGGGRRGPG